MPYLRRSGAETLSPELIDRLGRLAGLTLPPEDLEELAVALTDQLASIAALERLDLAGVDPLIRVDPRWPDHG